MQASKFEKHRDQMRRPLDPQEQYEKFSAIMMDKDYDEIEDVYFYKQKWVKALQEFQEAQQKENN